MRCLVCIVSIFNNVLPILNVFYESKVLCALSCICKKKDEKGQNIFQTYNVEFHLGKMCEFLICNVFYPILMFFVGTKKMGSAFVC